MNFRCVLPMRSTLHTQRCGDFPDRQIFNFVEDSGACPLQASAAVRTHGHDAQVIYRCARAAYNLSVVDPSRKAALLDEALRLVRDAKALNSRDSNILRWSGIILQAWSEGQSTKEYIEAAFKVKGDWEAAVEANPRDARSWHLLGRWALAVSAMPYWKRSLAVS